MARKIKGNSEDYLLEERSHCVQVSLISLFWMMNTLLMYSSFQHFSILVLQGC